MRGPFPSGSAFSVLNLARTAGELQAVASRKDLATLACNCECPIARRSMEKLAQAAGADGADHFAGEILDKRKSVLDVLDELEDFLACDSPLAVFLELIPMLSPRYYSISLSPDAAPDRCSITVGLVKGPALSGKGEFKGTATHYLCSLEPGDGFKATVRKPTAKFRLAEDPGVPILMVGPSTGIAPFRGFAQRRETLLAPGEKVASLIDKDAHIYMCVRRWRTDGACRVSSLDRYLCRSAAMLSG